MAQLNYKEIKVLQVESGDLEEFIEEVYGHEFNFAQDEELNRGVLKEYSIDGKLDKWEEKEVEEFAEDGDGQYITSKLLNDLCKKKLIPEGLYQIEWD